MEVQYSMPRELRSTKEPELLMHNTECGFRNGAMWDTYCISLLHPTVPRICRSTFIKNPNIEYRGIAYELKKPAWKDALQDRLAQPVSGEQNRSMALGHCELCHHLRTLLDISIAFHHFGFDMLITIRAPESCVLYSLALPYVQGSPLGLRQ